MTDTLQSLITAVLAVWTGAHTFVPKGSAKVSEKALWSTGEGGDHIKIWKRKGSLLSLIFRGRLYIEKNAI